MPGPLVAVSPDVRDGRVRVSEALLQAVIAAGGVPVVLSHAPAAAMRVLEQCHALVIGGGDDPRMEPFGQTTNAHSVLVHPARQALDLALLDVTADRPDMPMLAICLGMQYMGLSAGGSLQQHLPDVLEHPELHQHNATHAIEGSMGEGDVVSHHRQALDDAGALEIIARAPDGVIEAVRRSAAAYQIGVQWHPERMGEGPLGSGVFTALVEAARVAAP